MSTLDLRYFKSLLPEVIEECSQLALEIGNQKLADHYKKLLEYSMNGGKCVRALATMQTYEILIGGPEKLTPENKRLIGLLGITTEMLQTNFLLLDDIMDGSSTRRGKTCWHLTEGIGLIGINDGIMISEFMYATLRRHFRHLACYTEIWELFHDVAIKTGFGQMLDLTGPKSTVYKFDMDLYRKITDLKSAYYTFYLPLSLALHLSGHTCKSTFETVREFSMQLGYMFQVQDDYLDCFGDPEKTGKVGTDIQEGKCTWLAVKFMEIAAEEDKEVFAENYGQDDKEALETVKALYRKVKLPEVYKKFEEDSFADIKQKMQSATDDVPKEMFYCVIEKIYGRRN